MRCACTQLENKLRASRREDEPPWTHMRHDSQGLELGIQKHDVDRKAHPAGVNAAAWNEEQAFVRAQLGATEQTYEARCERTRDRHLCDAACGFQLHARRACPVVRRAAHRMSNAPESMSCMTIGKPMMMNVMGNSSAISGNSIFTGA